MLVMYMEVFSSKLIARKSHENIKETSSIGVGRVGRMNVVFRSLTVFDGELN